MESWELAAREEIRELVASYAELVDGGRFEELVLLFAEEGVLEIKDHPVLSGRQAILQFLGGTRTSLAAATTRPLIRHHVSTLRIRIEGPSAAGAASYFFVVTERGPDHWGRYRDRFERLGGRWLFRHRRVTIDGRAAGSWAAGEAES